MRRRLQLTMLLLCVAIAMGAQKKGTASARKTPQRTTQRKAAPATQRRTKTQRRTTTQRTKSPVTTTTNKATQQRVKQQGAKAAQEAKKAALGSKAVKNLESERQKVQNEIKEQQKRLAGNERTVKQKMEELMVIGSEIADKVKTIDTIRHDITTLDGSIALLGVQLDTLQRQLEQRKERYMASMRYMRRTRSIESKLLFIFSARNFTEMFRRQRFVHEYASYQRAQGEAVKSKQDEIAKKQEELKQKKQQKDALLARDVKERKLLEEKQEEQQQKVNSLKKEQKTIHAIIADQRKKDAALNAEIDRIVAREMELARQRAEEEARQQAAIEAARKQAEELARKKAAAEAAARENARRIAEAKAKEDQLKAQARAAARRNAQEKAAAERAARAAESERQKLERRAAEEAKVREREITEAKRSSTEVFTISSEDRRISGSFERNRGRLPIPITGGYRIVTHFGQYCPPGTTGVVLDNKGINLKGQGDANVQSIFDGEVSYIVDIGGQKTVLVRHGSYISVYCNLSSVRVRKGDKVKTRQALGTLAAGDLLHFQLRKEKQKLNPEVWLGR